MPEAHRRRVRLDSPIIPPPSLILPDETDQDRISQGITPESLAYALPGGLAKLHNPRWIYAPHIRIVEDALLKIMNGIPVRLIATMPPRHGKTVFLSRTLSAWFLGRRPEEHVILITHHTDFSRKHGRASRNLLTQYGESVFDIKVSEDSQAAGDWEIAGYGGGMESVGALAGIQGKGANLLLVDDIVKGFKMASNIAMLEEQWDWFNVDVLNRLEPNASVIITITRWSTLDIPGQIEDAMSKISGYEDWEIINLPAIALDDDPLGRPKGAALFPQRYPIEVLRKIERRMDPYWWEALFQGRPSPAKGSIINIDWFNRYGDPPPREDAQYCIISVDTAMKETEISDYTVFGVWFIYQGDCYLIDVIRERMSFPALLEMCVRLNNRIAINPDMFLIEDKGSGTSLIQQLRATEPDINVVAFDPGTESKVLRMQDESPAIRIGNVYLPEDEKASWLSDYLDEMKMFPKGRKDQADMTSQLLRFVRQQIGGAIEMW